MSNNIGSLYSANGRLVLVTQGLTGALLVAGKQCLFRVLLTQFEIGRVDRIIATITRPAPLAKTAIVLPRAYLRVEATAPLGPSVGVEIRGYAFPKSGSYEVGLLVEDAGGATIASVSLQFEFTATRDLRVLVV